MNILVTSGHTFDAPNVVALAADLRSAGHFVVVVAPATDRSSDSVSVSQSGKVRADRQGNSDMVWAVHGTPADSVIFGVTHVFRTVLAREVDVVISGIVDGWAGGLADRFSGTIGAAVCARALGVPAVAVSGPTSAPRDRDLASRAASVLTALLTTRKPGELAPPGVVLGLTIPIDESNRPMTAVATLHGGGLRAEVTGGRGEFSYSVSGEGSPRSDGAISLSAVPVGAVPGGDVMSHLKGVADELTHALAD